MKTLINHLINNHLDRIVQKSLLNCHCVGLHSIMLLESPEQSIRLFVAEQHHQLHRNFKVDDQMSIAFHPHHCNLTLHVIKGELTNMIIKPCAGEGIELVKWKYKSAITDSQVQFKKDERNKVGKYDLTTTILPGGLYIPSISMKASDIHTVAVAQGNVASWFVYEGKEDPSYKPVCYSNAPLDKQDFSNLYQKADVSKVVQLLSLAELL